MFLSWKLQKKAISTPKTHYGFTFYPRFRYENKFSQKTNYTISSFFFYQKKLQKDYLSNALDGAPLARNFLEIKSLVVSAPGISSFLRAQ
jgi:hypothetical protein